MEHLEIRRRLAAIGKNRQWLAKQLNKSEETVRQYLQPKGKRTKELMDDIDRLIVLEEARQREGQADAPPWNVLFATADEFDRADRASRAVDSTSLVDFCRAVILKRSDEILEEKKRSRYPVAVKPATKVAEGKRK